MSTDVRNATASSEDGFHEIHLSGKQLVFLFMATTVVSIVIFLCGVLVGRGVTTDATEGAGVVQAPPIDAGSQPADGVGTAGSQATSVPASELGYYDRLGDAEPTADTVKLGTEVPEPVERTASPPSPPPADATRRDQPAVADPPPLPAREAAPAAERNADATAPAASPASTATAPAMRTPGGWTVQVAAVRQRSEADAIANRLVAKGYDAYVVAPGAGASPPMFRVRVGSYQDRGEAERMMRRLTEQERFKPWITR